MFDTGKPLILGHRGAPFAAPENTVASFLAALDQGADGVELDVQLTRDGALALFHDTVVAGRPVHQHTLPELGLALGHPVETLEQVFEALPVSALINVEFKRQGSLAELDAHRRLTTMARERGIETTFIGSFDPWFLRACATVAPDVPRALILDGRMLAHPAAFDADWLDFVDGISMDHALLDGPIADRARAAGKFTLAWPVDDEAGLRRALNAGLGAVITKRPALAAAIRA